MAKVRVNSKTLALNFLSSAKNALGSSVLSDAGEKVVQRQRQYARRGTPLQEKKPSPGVFPPLKDSSVAIRKRLSKSNATHETFSPKRANVTFSGQLLNAIRFIVNKSSFSLTFEVQDTKRKPAVDAKGKKVDDESKSNKDVYRGLLDLNQNYQFLGLDSKGLEVVKNIVIRALRRRLR